MTVQEFVDFLDTQPLIIAGILLAVPVITFLTGLMHRKDAGGHSPWRYLYAVLVYLACIPGVIAAVMTGYLMLFVGQNLLEVSVAVYLLPIGTMAATLLLIGRRVDLERVPGFERLTGLMTLIACTFGILMFLDRLQIWLVFHGSFFTLILLGIAVFLVLRWSFHRMTGAGREAVAER